MGRGRGRGARGTVAGGPPAATLGRVTPAGAGPAVDAVDNEGVKMRFETYANVMVGQPGHHIEVGFHPRDSFTNMKDYIYVTISWPKPDASGPERLIGAKMDLEHEISHMKYTHIDVWDLVLALSRPDHKIEINGREQSGAQAIEALLRRHERDGWRKLLGKFPTPAWLNAQPTEKRKLIKILVNIYGDGHDEWRHKLETPGAYAAVVAGYELGRRHGREIFPSKPDAPLWIQIQSALLNHVLPHHYVNPADYSPEAWSIYQQLKPYATAAVIGKSVDVLHQALLTYEALERLGVLDQIAQQQQQQEQQEQQGGGAAVVAVSRPQRDARGSANAKDFALTGALDPKFQPPQPTDSSQGEQGQPQGAQAGAQPGQQAAGQSGQSGQSGQAGQQGQSGQSGQSGQAGLSTPQSGGSGGKSGQAGQEADAAGGRVDLKHPERPAASGGQSSGGDGQGEQPGQGAAGASGGPAEGAPGASEPGGAQGAVDQSQEGADPAGPQSGQGEGAGQEPSEKDRAEAEAALQEMMSWAAQEVVIAQQTAEEIRKERETVTEFSVGAGSGSDRIVSIRRDPFDQRRYDDEAAAQWDRAMMLAENLKRLSEDEQTEITGERRGRRLDGRRLYRVPMGDDRVRKRTTEEEGWDAEFVIGADCSYSMRPNAAQLQGAIVQTHLAAKELGIRHAVWGFGGNGQFELMGFDDEDESRIGSVSRLIDGGTPMTRAVQIYTHLLTERSQKSGAKKDRVAFVVCDGQPDDPVSCAAEIKAARDQNVTIFGILLRPKNQQSDSATRAMENLFGDQWAFIKSLDELPDIVGERLESVILAARGSMTARRRLR